MLGRLSQITDLQINHLVVLVVDVVAVSFLRLFFIRWRDATHSHCCSSGHSSGEHGGWVSRRWMEVFVASESRVHRLSTNVFGCVCLRLSLSFPFA